MSPPLKLQNPNDRRPPSARDQEIYRLCKAQRMPQKQVAKDYAMSEGNVSQIVKKVREWLANASARGGELDHNQERRLERRIERERLEHLYGKSLRMLDDFEKPSTASREGAKGTEKTTREERNARVQALKSCTRLAESLGRIAEREPLPPPPGEEQYIHPARLYAELKHQREEAEERTAVPVSENSHELVGSLLHALVGQQIHPQPAPGSSLAAAMLKIAEALAAAAGAAVVRGQESESRGGSVVAATTQGVTGGMASDPLCEAAAATHNHLGNSHSEAGSGAKETKLAGYSLLDGCDPEILDSIVANGWLERFKDGGEMHRESLVAASLAREKNGEFSAAAAGSKVQSPRSKVAEAGSVVAATTQSVAGERGRESIAATTLADGARLSQLTPDPLPAAPANRPAPPRGIDVVGSPEWKVARAKWLKERDERVQAERERQMRAKAADEADRYQRRAAAAERRRWLEAGRCQY